MTKGKRLKREAPLLIFNAQCESHIVALEKSPDIKTVVFKGALDAIQYAVAENKQDAEIFRLQDNRSIVYLPKSNWKPVLTEAMSYYADSDIYDKALECQSLLQLI